MKKRPGISQNKSNNPESSGGYSVVRLAVAVIFTLMVAGCATVEEPVVLQAPASGTAESATLVQQRSREAEFGAYRVLKRKVAVARFSNETNYGRSFLIDDDFDPIGKQALDILSTKLQQTGKFILLERGDLEKINAELKLANRDQLKNMADYLILGSIAEFGRKTEGESGIFSRTKKQVAYAKVTIRLVDVYTGEIIFADDGYGEAFSEVGTTLGLGTKAGYDSTLNDQAIDAAISNLASAIIENLLEKPWRSYLLAKEENLYIIGGGQAQGLRIGDKFTVLKKGRTIVNPQTGVEVMLPGTPVATLSVIQLAGSGQLNEISMTELIDGLIPEGADFSNYIIEEKKLN